MAEALYKIEDDHYYGTIVGLWIADTSTFDELKGKEIYLGEALGKHSDVSVTVDEETVIKVTEDPLVIAMVRQHGLEIGTNVFDSYDPDQDEDEDD